MTTPGRARVACNRPLADADAQQRLEEIAEVVVAPDGAFAEALATANGAIVIRPQPLTAEMIASARQLRVVATVSSGSDHVDAVALRSRGIHLVTGEGAAPRPVAEWVVWALLSCRRQLNAISSRFVADDLDWGSRLSGFSSRQLSEMTLGLVGYGNIGRLVHRLVGPFDVKVLVFDPFYNGPTESCELVDSLDELCARSDAVSVHVPLSNSTRGMITRRELALIGPNGLVINAARGGIVEETDLLDALVEGDLGAAAVDCFASEPPEADYVAALLRTRQALLTPHVAGVSVEALAILCGHAVNGIAAVLDRAADGLSRGVP